MSKLMSCFLPFMLLLMLAACKKEENLGNNCTDGSANFPHIAVGHRVDYFVNLGPSFEDTVTWSVDSIIRLGTYFVRWRSKNGIAAVLDADIYCYACGNDYYISLNRDYDPNENMYVSLDANVGDTWTRADTGLNANVSCKLLSKNATFVTAKSGQIFNSCIQVAVNPTGASYTDTVYFKPEYGIVAYKGSHMRYEMIGRNF